MKKSKRDIQESLMRSNQVAVVYSQQKTMENVIKIIKEEFVTVDKLIDNKIPTVTNKLNQKIDSLAKTYRKEET